MGSINMPPLLGIVLVVIMIAIIALRVLHKRRRAVGTHADQALSAAEAAYLDSSHITSSMFDGSTDAAHADGRNGEPHIAPS